MRGGQDDADQVHPKDRKAWRAWLSRNHQRDNGVWLVSWKKTTAKSTVTYEQAVEEALCFGWIDSKGRKLDDERSMLWFAPRNPRSAWSKLNKERVARLEKEGLIAEAGAKVIEAAKASGTWAVLDEVEALVVPSDLKKAFARHRGARKNWDAFPKSAKRGILEWIVTAKRPETRAKRVEETARLAAENVRANQWRRSP